MSFINIPFSWLLNFFYDTFQNYGIAILLFGVLVKLIMMPFQIKSKSSMMRTNVFQPQMQELQKKYGSDQRKYQEEVSKLYKREKVNPMSGCIWTLIPFPILILLYGIMRQPLTNLMHLTEDQVAAVTNTLVDLGKYVAPARAGAFDELTLANLVHENFSAVQAAVPQIKDIDFSFLGMNLSQVPQWNFFLHIGWADTALWLPALGLFLIPLVSALLSYFTMKLSQRNNPAQAANPAMAGTNKTMMLMGPVMSLIIGFTLPAALGIYWISQSLMTCGEEIALGGYYRRKMEAERAAFTERERARNEELESKRKETERLKAEGKTTVNTSTSKKKLVTQQRVEDEARRAAAERAERAARRAKLGVPEPETPASQVGTRRYARGRAFVEARYESPETAEEATALAAEESENYAASCGGEDFSPPADEASDTPADVSYDEEDAPDSDEYSEDDEADDEL